MKIYAIYFEIDGKKDRLTFAVDDLIEVREQLEAELSKEYNPEMIKTLNIYKHIRL